MNSGKKLVTALAIGFGVALFEAATAPEAHAAKWWNPKTWFEESTEAKAEKAQYKADRPGMVQTLEEAKQTGDRDTIKRARKELRDYDKAHDKRMHALRKQEHERKKLAHKEEHKATKSERAEMKKPAKTTGLDRAEDRADEHAEHGLRTARDAQEKKTVPKGPKGRRIGPSDVGKIFDGGNHGGMADHILDRRERAHDRSHGGGKGKGKGR